MELILVTQGLDMESSHCVSLLLQCGGQVVGRLAAHTVALTKGTDETSRDTRSG